MTYYLKGFRHIYNYQNIFGTSRIRLLKNNVEPRSKYQKIIGLLFFILHSFCVYQMIFYTKLSILLCNKFSLMKFLQSISAYYLHMFEFYFLDHKKNLELFSVCNFICSKLSNRVYKKNEYLFDWLLAIIIFYNVYISSMYVVDFWDKIESATIFLLILHFIGQVVIDGDNLFLVKLTTFLSFSVKEVNSILISYINVNRKGIKMNEKADNEKEKKRDLSEIVILIERIIYGHYLLNVVYQLKVLMYCWVTFFWFIYTVQDITREVINKQIETSTLLGLCVRNGKNIIVVLALSVYSERFLMHIDTTKYLSIMMMDEHYEGPIYDNAKKILKLITKITPSFSVFGMYELDARLPLKILVFTTTFIVALLQFAFL